MAASPAGGSQGLRLLGPTMGPPPLRGVARLKRPRRVGKIKAAEARRREQD